MATNNEQKLRSRTYQLEMFGESTSGNIIVAMGTGLGKTHVASLRIDFELQRTPNKRIWMTAPNVVLAEQQHAFLSSQLRQYQMRTLLGHNGVDLWRTQNIWNQALAGIHVVISTPQVLLDGLRNAFLQLPDISLLIFDEAHHCQASNPGALIMKEFYHPLKSSNPTKIPHILGLTASSQMGKKADSTKTLETTLDAKCRTPTRTVEDYKEHTFLPQIVPLELMPGTHCSTSKMMETLEIIVHSMCPKNDPYYQALQKADDLGSQQKLQDLDKGKLTPAMIELKALAGNARHIYENLGSWASDYFARNCVENWYQKTLKFEHQERYLNEQYIDIQVSRLRNMRISDTPFDHLNFSPKARCLVKFLLSEYRTGIAVIVFVERRATAFALSELLRQSLPQYRVFSFVGLATFRRASLIEVADMRVQKQAFADFRVGSQDICVATSVAEEGIDIQAVNIVVRYDDPKQFVSFVQSRGRARCQDSKFVYFQDPDGNLGKYSSWQCLEKALQEEYQSQMSARSMVLDAEEQAEDGNLEYIVQTTGALLNFHNAKTHLQHFCDTLPVSGKPIYIFSGEIGKNVTAKVVLPSSLPANLQQFSTELSWLSQKQAERGAAFQAFKALHVAELVDDHLMPFRPEKPIHDQPRHGFRTCDVEGEHPVWTSSSCDGLYAHQLTVLFDHTYLGLELILVLPRLLPHNLECRLAENSTLSSLVTVCPMGHWTGDTAGAKKSTQHLFASAFDIGSAYGSLTEENSIPLLLPLKSQQQSWSQTENLSSFIATKDAITDKQPLLVWRDGRRRPFIWKYLSQHADAKIIATPVRKLQLYTHARNCTDDQMAGSKRLEINDCYTNDIGTTVGPAVLLLPSVLHIMEGCFRAEDARKKLLLDVGLQPSNNLSAALLAPSAAGILNYERLEFLGDTMLKFYTSVQVFFSHDDAHEGVLTIKSMEILSNTRLETAVQGLGIVKFLTTKIPAQKHWKTPVIVDEGTSDGRKLDSKTLADCAESVLAAVFLDGDNTLEGDEKSIRFLQLLLPEICWHTPDNWIHSQEPALSVPQESILQARIKVLLRYEFTNQNLLLEALTHSSSIPGRRSLDRLEFLGDAIIDRIIKYNLFTQSSLDAGQMTKCRHALASHHWLAYCGFESQLEVQMCDVITKSGKVQVSKRTKTIYLTDLISFADQDSRKQIEDSRARYSNLRDQVEIKLTSAFPWTTLRAINAPKVCSDIVESLIAAVYLDSGSLVECEKILDRLGVTRLLGRMIADEAFEVETPAARLRELCASRKIDLCFSTTEEADGSFAGRITLAGTEIVEATGECKEEAESRAAELALGRLIKSKVSGEDRLEQDQDVIMENIAIDSGDEAELNDGGVSLAG